LNEQQKDRAKKRATCRSTFHKKYHITMTTTKVSSRIPGFHELTLEERRTRVPIAPGDVDTFTTKGGLSEDAASHMIENVIGQYTLPLAV
jgi:hydroxymethylglutaryl-CoA reductase